MESLVWVVVDDAPRHVSTFAHLPPRRRPRATCPECGRRLTLKLGAVRRHHAAHATSDVCSATQPETALHLSCKIALAEALRAAIGSGAVLSIVRQCAGVADADCNEISTTEWVRGWDDVVVERRVGDARRPDIVLLRDGQPIGAIEVVVSNAVSVDKARALSELGITWIEVAASEDLTRADAWSRDTPLAVSKLGADEWRCAPHYARHTTLGHASTSRRAAEAEDARHEATLRAARVVDVYHVDGARDRFIYTITELSTDGRVHTARLKRGGLELASAPAESTEALRLAFTVDIQHLARHDGSFTDSPMRWAIGDAAANIVEEALIDRVGNDPTPLATTFPRRWFFNRDEKRWFRASELRDARWDREADDPFAAHPAWAKARAAVRERPAPEGSWNTLVFAGRPIGAMFRQSVKSTRRDETGTLTVVELASPMPAALVVVERETTASAIGQVASELRDAQAEVIWLSHPRDWSVALADLPWTPAGRDGRGKGAVVVDGVGVFTADQFARAVVKRDKRVSPRAISESSRERVRRLRGTPL